MGIDKHLKQSGVQLADDNSLPKGERTQRSVKRLIAAVRAAEGEFNDALHSANERCREAQAQVILLQERNRVLEGELRKYKVRDELHAMDKLTAAEQKRLEAIA